MGIRKLAAGGIVAAVLALALAGCGPAGRTTVTFALTDAPVDNALVSAVNVTVSGVRINESATAVEGDGTWTSIGIDPPQTLDLLSLQNGLTGALGSVQLAGGTQINQVRLQVDSVQVVYNGTPYTASVSSGDTTGLKIVGAFDVPLSGAMTVTIDFDARKSIVLTGPSWSPPAFRLKPVLRAVVDGEAGSISGTGPANHVIYAYRYADGVTSWSAAEETPNADGLAFTGAYSSAATADPNVDGIFTYRLAFLEGGTYDLVVVDPAAGTVAKIVTGVTVTAGHDTVQDITLP